MFRKKWRRKQTRLKIKTDEENAIKSAITASKEARKKLERFIAKNPEFRTSLEPLSLHEGNYSGIIAMMIKSSKIAKVGPFAAVAGSISQIAVEAGLEEGADNMLVDNGGDISISGDSDFNVGIFAGESPASGKFAFSLKSEDLPRGICTSSGTVGHSMSFGEADAVVIVSEKAPVSDAVATAVANEVKGKDVEHSVKKGLDRADDITEIDGCLIIREGHVGRVGSLPEILSLPENSKAYPQELTDNSFPVLE